MLLCCCCCCCCRREGLLPVILPLLLRRLLLLMLFVLLVCSMATTHTEKLLTRVAMITNKRFIPPCPRRLLQTATLFLLPFLLSPPLGLTCLCY